MNKIVSILALVLFCAISSGSAAEKPLGVDEFTSIDQLASEIASYFPKVQGEVTAVSGDRLTIGLGTKNGLISGVALALWRDGKEIHHPVTGAVIGREEDAVGSAEVTSLAETTCTAIMLERRTDPKVGDKARITPKKINLALVPVHADRPEIIQGLADRLNETGRFAVLGSDTVASFLKDKKQRDVTLIKEMSKTYNLDVIVACDLYPSEGGKLLLTARLFYADEARSLDTIVAILDLKSKDVYGDIKPFFAPVTEQKANSPDLPFDAKFFVAADFEGTGSVQYAFSDGVKVHIYQQGSSGWQEEWSEPVTAEVVARSSSTGDLTLGTTTSAGDIQQINLDVADINGNGRPELFVTSMHNGRVSSYVVEFRDGAYQRIAEIPGFLRVISYPGKSSILIGKDFDQKSFFAGNTRQYVWSDGRYVPGKEFPLPKDVNFYGFVVAAIGETNPCIVALDAKDHLMVYSRDTLIWRSEETYPAVGVTVHKGASSAATAISESLARAEKGEKIRITGRIAALDVNGNGRDEILLPKNSGDTFFGGYSHAEFVCLGWTGTRLEQRWTIKDIDGAVLDFQISGQEGSGMQVLSLVKTLGGLIARDRIRVMGYALK